eukprot:g400.t1
MWYLCEELGIPFRTWSMWSKAKDGRGFPHYLDSRYDPRVNGPGLSVMFHGYRELSEVEFIARFVSMGCYATAHYVARTLCMDSEQIKELDDILDTFERSSRRFPLLSAPQIRIFRRYLSTHNTIDHDVSAECVWSLGYAVGTTFTIPLGEEDLPLRGKVVATYPPHRGYGDASQYRVEIRWDISAFDKSQVQAYARGVAQIYTVQAIECAKYRRSEGDSACCT